jgi:hypothetical protein
VCPSASASTTKATTPSRPPMARLAGRTAAGG